jgi:ABC-type multidrug transport system fused ATPase/permease subunit
MNWVFAAIGSIIGSIILSVLGNILTDPIKGWFAKTSLQSRKNRISELNNELENIRKYKQDNNKFTAESVTQLLNIFILFIIIFVLGLLSASCTIVVFLGIDVFKKDFWEGILGIGLFALLLFILLTPTCIAYIITTIRFMAKIKDFDQYEKNIQEKITSLQISDKGS